ncbi:MAG: autotransporter-associated beta strand repeat-containing protein, partial [Verrucomicrobia bacterium]|nr:autotransporter-associated beta strand repeat-containing protein [Verrucomicrobiota bacterium]
GDGILTLSGINNSYTGPTAVNAGTLAVTGALGATAVTVNSPATLAGNGNIGGSVTIATGAHHALAVAATAGTQVTRAITGTLTMTDSILDLTAASTPAAGEYVLATATVAITGTPTTINYNGISGGTVSVDTTSTPIRLLLTIGGSPYGTWANGTFANGATLSDKDPTHDPDGDTLTNLQEYAFGMDPTVSFSGGIVYVTDGSVSTHGQPVIFPQGNDYFTVFGRRTDYLTSGVTYTAQFSAGLDVWVDNDDIANSPVQVASDGVIDAIRVKYPESIVTPSGSRKPTFSRLKVIMP